MISDTIEAVKRAEARAGEFSKEARAVAEDILKNAQNDAESMKAAAAEHELRSRQQAAEKAEEEAKDFVAAERQKALKEAEKIREAARKDEAKAVAAATKVILG